ncbi:MAG: putative glycoside hydrolase, partial [bacterium]|nr:putative glycoside hydrolase [bacterium]
MENKHKIALGIAGFFIFVLVLIFAIIPFFTRDTYSVAGIATKIDAKTDEPIVSKQEIPLAAHIPIPKEVKAIYMSSCVAGTKHFRDDLVAQIERTELNAVIIDIKDYTGLLSFTPRDPKLASFLSDRCYAPDMEAFIKTLHEKNIYVIGRITAFQDPHYAKLHPEIAVKRASDG